MLVFTFLVVIFISKTLFSKKDNNKILGENILRFLEANAMRY
jgi:hypothetical protein